MTIRIKGRVQKIDDAWLAVAAALDSMTPMLHRWAGSHTQAVADVNELIADLDQRLMAEVHASRATRRQENRS